MVSGGTTPEEGLQARMPAGAADSIIPEEVINNEDSTANVL